MEGGFVVVDSGELGFWGFGDFLKICFVFGEGKGGEGNMGRVYWGRKEEERKVEGIVVVFAWLSSQEKNLKPYVQLYASLGWNSIICHSDFLHL